MTTSRAVSLAPTAALRVHPAAEAIPGMRPAEWRAFLEDIRERGILEPLRVAEDGLTVLDGRHRLKAAIELGLAEVPVTPAGSPPGGEAAFALRAAILRRHLSDDQRAVLAHRLTQVLTPERWGKRESGTGVIPLSVSGGRSRQIAAKALGVSERRLRTAQALARDAPDLAAMVESGSMALRAAQGRVEHRAALAELATVPKVDLPEGEAEVWQGDAFDLADRIPEGSVDMILTDPPYGTEYLDLWPRLGQLAARVLRPGGFLVAYVGHMFLPDELEGLASGGLEWWWAAAITFHGQRPAIRVRRVRTGFRPVAILRQPGGHEAPWFSDLFVTDPRPQKGLHPWQQSLGPARALVRRFSFPGAVVLDPFAGSGTFPLAALLEGRRTLGIELDPEHAATARARIAAALAERDGKAEASA